LFLKPKYRAFETRLQKKKAQKYSRELFKKPEFFNIKMKEMFIQE